VHQSRNAQFWPHAPNGADPYPCARHGDSDDALGESDRRFLALLEGRQAGGLQFLLLAALVVAARRSFLLS